MLRSPPFDHLPNELVCLEIGDCPVVCAITEHNVIVIERPNPHRAKEARGCSEFRVIAKMEGNLPIAVQQLTNGTR